MPNKFDVKRCNVKGPDFEVRRGRAFYNMGTKTLYVAKQEGDVVAISGLPYPTQKHNQRNVWELGPYTIDRKGCQTGCGGNRLATVNQDVLMKRAEPYTTTTHNHNTTTHDYNHNHDNDNVDA